MHEGAWWRSLSAGVGIALALGGAKAVAGPADDLSNRKRDYESAKSSLDNWSSPVANFLEKSRKLREMDKTELDELINQICGLDIEPNEDRERQLADSLRDKVIEKVKAEYNTTDSEGAKLDESVRKVLNDIRSLIENTKPLTSMEEVKSDANSLLSSENSLLDRGNDLWNKLNNDYKTLTNVRNGVMNGANNPRLRATMEYGKDKHIYNQRICEEKEIEISSGGKADCVTFVKDNCAVWEFKSDRNFSDSSAASWARDKYLSGITEKFKNDPRAIANCKKDSNGAPTFEAKGAVYPACKPSMF